MEVQKIVAFKLGNEEYGLDINHVLSIERIHQMTRVPNAVSFVKGVINLRGNITPIIDLCSRLNLGKTNYTESTRVIITKYGEVELGLIVDQTSEVLDVPPEAVEAFNSIHGDADYFGGVAKIGERLIILLKMEELAKVPVS